MAVFDLFSKRRARAEGKGPEIYMYEVPVHVRVQIMHIWKDALGLPGDSFEGNVEKAYQFIVDTLRREYGVFRLGSPEQRASDEPWEELGKFFLSNEPFQGRSDLDKTLDVIELSFSVIDSSTRDFSYMHRRDPNGIVNGAIQELNDRFKEAGVGYHYVSGRLARIDSEFIHVEAVKPALAVLHDRKFATAEAEFLAAHEKYRHGKNADALIECLKAFESTMKIICTKRGWAFDSKKGAADLVNVCLTNGLIPDYYQGHINALRSVLESAIPTPRNKQAGHGAGTQAPHHPSNELVSYVLHMTAATILFLVESDRALP